MALKLMHETGLVHGDLTPTNIVLRISEKVSGWTDDEVYDRLGVPYLDKVIPDDGQPLGPHAPEYLVLSISPLNETLLQEAISIIDFGQSYATASPPDDYEPATVMYYEPPEMRFDQHAGPEADVWMLGCVLFEIRAGFPLFDSSYGSSIDVLKVTVETLGRLPDTWWDSFDNHHLWFTENGDPGDYDCRTSIRERLELIGVRDARPAQDKGTMIEKTGIELLEREVDLMGDLLEKMLRYCPEERITMSEVVEHPWFTYSES